MELCADSPGCCAKAWLEHNQQHRECLEACPVLMCLAQRENLVCNQTLHHNLGHLGDVPEPEKFLELLLSRPWLPSAFPGALTAAWGCRTSKQQQLFSIASATKAVLIAAPSSIWTAHSLVSALQLAAVTSDLFDHADQLAALQHLLDAKQGPWTPRELTPVLDACCKTLETSNALSVNSKQYQILEVLFNCCAPQPCAAVDQPGQEHTSIGHFILQAISYGAAPSILELLLSKAPDWHPDSLQRCGPNTPVNNGHIVPADFSWVRDCPDYVGHYPVIIQAAAERQVTAALVPHLLFLAQPFDGRTLEQATSIGTYERIVVFIGHLLQQGGLSGRSEITNTLFTSAMNQRNVVLLAILAGCKIKFPKAILQPLVVVFAVGTADCDAETVHCLLAMADEPWMDHELMQGLIVVAEGSRNQVTGVTYKMVSALCSPHSWAHMVVLAAQCKLTCVHQLLLNSATGQTMHKLQNLPGQVVAQPFGQHAAAITDAAPQVPGKLVKQLVQAHTWPAAQSSGPSSPRRSQLQHLQQLGRQGRPKQASAAAQSRLSGMVPGLPYRNAAPAQWLNYRNAASAAALVAAQLAAAQPNIVNITWLPQAVQGPTAQGQALGGPTGQVAILLPRQATEPSAGTVQATGAAAASHVAPSFTAQRALQQPAAVGKAASASFAKPGKRARVIGVPAATLEAQTQQQGGPASPSGRQQHEHEGELQTSAAANNRPESPYVDGFDMLLAAAGIDVDENIWGSSMEQHQLSPCKRDRQVSASGTAISYGSPLKGNVKAKAPARRNRKGQVRKPGAPSMASGGVQVEKTGPAQLSNLSPVVASSQQATATMRHEADQSKGPSPGNQPEYQQQHLTRQDSVEEAAAVLTALKQALPDNRPIAVTRAIHAALDTEAENFVAAAFPESPIQGFAESPMKVDHKGYNGHYGPVAASPGSAGSPGIARSPGIQGSRTGRATPSKTVRFNLPGDVAGVAPVARQLLPATHGSDPGPVQHDMSTTMQPNPTGTQPTADVSYPAQAWSPGTTMRYILNLRRASSLDEPDDQITVLQQQQQQQSRKASTVGVSRVSGLGMASQLLLRHRQSLGLPVTMMEQKTASEAMCQLQPQQAACVPPASAMGLFIRTKLPSPSPAVIQQQPAAAFSQQPKRQLVKLDLRRASEQDADDRSTVSDGQGALGARPEC